MKLNLGCGKRYMDGWVNIDVSPVVKTDVRVDIGREGLVRRVTEKDLQPRVDSGDLTEGSRGYKQILETNYTPIEDDSVECINARAFLAHVQRHQLPIVMNECWRVLKPGGCMFIMVPYAGSDAYHSDPTHMTGFTLATLKHFTKWSHERRDADYGWPCKFLFSWTNIGMKNNKPSYISVWFVKPSDSNPEEIVGSEKNVRDWNNEILSMNLYPNGYMGQ